MSPRWTRPWSLVLLVLAGCGADGARAAIRPASAGATSSGATSAPSAVASGRPPTVASDTPIEATAPSNSASSELASPSSSTSPSAVASLPQPPPPPPIPPPGAVERVVARDVRACAIFQNGMLQCWGGFNFDGQLGVGNTKEVTTPTWVKHIHDVKKLELGRSVTCAIVGSGALFCWGRNQFIKDDSRKFFPDPTQVPGLSGVTSVSVGDNYTCAVDGSGDVYCWGDNGDGQLGLGGAKIRDSVLEPTRVRGVRDVVGVAAGTRDTYAWTKSGELYRWGSSGEPLKPWAAPEPRLVAGLSGVKRAWVEGQDACAEIADRQIRCFIPESLDALAAGKQLDLGPQLLAIARAFTRKKFIKLPKMILPDARELRDVIDVLVFYHDASALTASGEVFSWGSPERGTVGQPERTKGLLPPTRIAGLSGVTQIAGGYSHRCALLKDGSVSCFGGLAPGRPRSDRKRGSEIPKVVAGLPKVRAIAAGDHCTFAIGEDNSLWAFGDSWVNACGEKESDTVSFDSPRRVPLDVRPPF